MSNNQAFSVFSEIGPLRRVLVHRPGLEIDWMVPSMMERLLFDDILDGEGARNEHDAFRGVLEAAGVETLDPAELLVDVVADPSVRDTLLDSLVATHELDSEDVEMLASMAPTDLARALVSGIRVDESERRPSPYGSSRLRRYYRLPPVPNYFFQRDPQVVVGAHVLTPIMATEARARESVLQAVVFRHALGGGDVQFGLDAKPGRPMPMLEGGDVLIASPDVVLVGLSERTNRWGIEALAQGLRDVGSGFRYLLVVELPPTRSYMHLDTVFTFIDEGLCLAHLPVIAPSGSEAGHVYRIDLHSDGLAYHLAGDLPTALGELGMPVELLACGGTASLIDQQREQWTDGANAFAIAPGVIVLYERNRRTIEDLDRRGWRILSESDVLQQGVPVVGEGPTVVTLVGNELARARGGPRCMTMPLVREPLVREPPVREPRARGAVS